MRLDRLLRNISIYIFIFALLTNIQAQDVSWENISQVPVNQPSWGMLIVSPIEPQVIFIATDAGLYRSDNAGYDWQSLPLPFDRGYAFALSSENPPSLYRGNGREAAIRRHKENNLLKIAPAQSFSQ